MLIRLKILIAAASGAYLFNCSLEATLELE